MIPRYNVYGTKDIIMKSALYHKPQEELWGLCSQGEAHSKVVDITALLYLQHKKG